jgi:hypothetical protein
MTNTPSTRAPKRRKRRRKPKPLKLKRGDYVQMEAVLIRRNPRDNEPYLWTYGDKLVLRFIGRGSYWFEFEPLDTFSVDQICWNYTTHYQRRHMALYSGHRQRGIMHISKFRRATTEDAKAFMEQRLADLRYIRAMAEGREQSFKRTLIEVFGEAGE